MVFLDPAIRGRIIESSYTRLALEFEVDAGAAHGPHYFRVVSPRGASNVLLFRVKRPTDPPSTPIPERHYSGFSGTS